MSVRMTCPYCGMKIMEAERRRLADEPKATLVLYLCYTMNFFKRGEYKRSAACRKIEELQEELRHGSHSAVHQRTV